MTQPLSPILKPATNLEMLIANVVRVHAVCKAGSEPLKRALARARSLAAVRTHEGFAFAPSGAALYGPATGADWAAFSGAGKVDHAGATALVRKLGTKAEDNSPPWTAARSFLRTLGIGPATGAEVYVLNDPTDLSASPSLMSTADTRALDQLVEAQVEVVRALAGMLPEAARAALQQRLAMALASLVPEHSSDSMNYSTAYHPDPNAPDLTEPDEDLPDDGFDEMAAAYARARGLTPSDRFIMRPGDLERVHVSSPQGGAIPLSPDAASPTSVATGAPSEFVDPTIEMVADVEGEAAARDMRRSAERNRRIWREAGIE